MLTLEQFVRESNRIEGITHKPSGYVLDAYEMFLGRDEIRLDTLQALVWAIQPYAMLRDKRGMDVVVGLTYRPPRGGCEIKNQLAELLAPLKPGGHDRQECFEVHAAYEALHPFMDGNGRSGRALWLWMRGGLDAAPLGFLHTYYYDALIYWRKQQETKEEHL